MMAEVHSVSEFLWFWDSQWNWLRQRFHRNTMHGCFNLNKFGVKGMPVKTWGKIFCNLRYRQNHNHRLFASRDVGALKVLWRELGWIQPSCYILIKRQCAWWYFFPFSLLVKEAQISLFPTLMFSLPCVYSVHVAYQEIEVQQIPGLLPAQPSRTQLGMWEVVEKLSDGDSCQKARVFCLEKRPSELFSSVIIENARLWGFQEV